MFTLCGRSRTPGLWLVLATCIALATALDPNFCAEINTGTGRGNYSDLQSNGLCMNYCKDDVPGTWAFAITQEYYCWCSNISPAGSIQVSDLDCDLDCPGYPFEKCGGSSGDTWGYVNVADNQPTATTGGGNESPSSTSASTTTATERVTETVQNTVTILPTVSSETEASSSTTSSSSSTTTTTDDTDDSTSMPTTAMVVETVTVDGNIQTVTVAPTVAPTDTADSSGSSPQDSGGDGGIGGGAIAGIVIGVVAGIAIVAVLIWWILRRRRDKDEAYKEDLGVGGNSDMMGGHRREMSMSNRSGGPPSPNSAGNRSSTLQVDPRMDPARAGVYMLNGSHESLNTIRDDQDYSRRILRTTNPDPE